MFSCSRGWDLGLWTEAEADSDPAGRTQCTTDKKLAAVKGMTTPSGLGCVVASIDVHGGAGELGVSLELVGEHYLYKYAYTLVEQMQTSFLGIRFLYPHVLFVIRHALDNPINFRS